MKVLSCSEISEYYLRNIGIEAVEKRTIIYSRMLTIYEIILLTGLDNEWAIKISEFLDSGVISRKVVKDIIGEAFPKNFCFKCLPSKEHY